VAVGKALNRTIKIEGDAPFNPTPTVNSYKAFASTLVQSITIVRLPATD